MITLDPAGFIVEGSRWWTDASGPKLTGSVSTNGGTVRAYIGSQAVGDPAVINGLAWSIQLPDGSIGATDTPVMVELSAPGEQAVTVEQVFDLDAGKPVVMVDAKLHSELADTISFASGEAVHTHAGPMIDMSSGCPDVYKYAYLTGTSAPPYGSEASPNPIAFHFTADSPVGLDTASSAARVRLEDGTIVVDWALLEAGADGSYPFTLYRDGSHAIARLATYEGKIYIDARFHDAFGHENVVTSCIQYHPMPAPLEILPIAHETTGYNLWNMSLPADSPVSWLLGQHDTAVAGQRFVQHAAEPITVHVDMKHAGVNWTKIVADHYVATDVSTQWFQCGTATSYSTDPRCQPPTYTDTDTPSFGSLSTGATWHAVVVDELTGNPASVCTGTTCTLPARQAGQAPHPYRVISYIGYVNDLWPMSSVPSEYTLLGRTYTGYAPTTVYGCTTKDVWFDNLNVRHFECQYTTYAHFIALDQATLAFLGITTSYSASVGGNVPLESVGYEPIEITSGYHYWDSQVDVLPGQ
jgi:hypothetical protein